MRRSVLLFLLLGATPLEAATFYVAPTGSDARSCATAQTITTPKQTINSGVGCLGAGDTLLVRAGTYAETLAEDVIPSGTSGTYTRVAAFSGETVWLTPSSGNYALWLSTHTFIDWDGINIDGRNLSAGVVLLFEGGGSTATNIRIQHAEIIGSPNAGNCASICSGDTSQFLHLIIHGGGENLGTCPGTACSEAGLYTGGNNNIIDDVEIYDTSLEALQIYSGTSTPTNNIVRNSKFHDIRRSGDPPPGRINVVEIVGANNQVYNNLIYNNGTWTGNAGIQVFGGGTSNTLIANNTLSANFDVGIDIDSGSGAIVRNNIIYQSATPIVDNATGTIQDHNLLGTNPQFVNQAGNNYALTVTSPAINAGVTIGSVPTDIIGTTRPQSTAYDIGAYEFIFGGPTTWTVTCPGTDLQATINSALLGDTINLTVGPSVICTGNYTLPNKPGTGTLTIQSAAMSSLPAGVRVGPSQTIALANVQTPNSSPVFATAVSAHGYLLRGLNLTTTSGATNDLITFGDGSNAQTTLAQVPTGLTIDRSYVHGHATLGTKRGIALNSASTSITNSTISDFKLSGQDAQAIAGWNGPGPFTITNNDIEGSGNNILFGGADASIPNLIPSDITITGNYLTKPLAWRGVWTVKNVLELKNAQRLTIDSNVFENNWLDAQTGIAILFTVANQDGSNTWADVAHVTFTNNVIRHAGGGFNISGWSFTVGHDSQIMSDVTIQNNLIYDISSANWGGNGYDVLIGHKPDTVTFRHNTFINTDSVGIIATAEPSTNFVAKDNLFAAPSYPIFGDNGVGPGNPAVTAYFPGSTWLDNAWAASVGSYPAMNYTPADIPTIQFQNYAGGNYRLAPTSPFIHAASDGGAVGVNIDALPAAANLPPNQAPSLVKHLGALLGVGP